MYRCLTLSFALLGFLNTVARGEDLLLRSLRCSDVFPPPPHVANAVSEDAAVAANAIQELRKAGPAGLEALLQAHQSLLESHARDPQVAASAEWKRLKGAIDAVSGQRDADVSRLYWYTDLAEAVSVAQREKKPILSLRLLGKLTDEFSCANSRFFRTALYANAEISQNLRKHYVLHWESVRPVPKVTIDFGDGRKLERTLTGNSIHYILDSTGRPFDALPGLYGPAAFLAQLQQIEAAVAETRDRPAGAVNSAIVRYHQRQLESIRTAWERDLTTLKLLQPAKALGRAEERPVAQADQPAQAAARAPDPAIAAQRLARPKSGGEMPMLRLMALSSTEALRAVTTPDVWDRLGALPGREMQLDDASIALIRRQNPGADTVAAEGVGVADGAAVGFEQSRLEAMVRSFQSAMAVDTVRNEYELHRQIHEWMIGAPEPKLDRLNERVYAELFLTPRSDPWLGLVSPETYTGLENGK